MITDTFFTIGKTHTICQDYAEQAADHVIVSDGCSTAPESNKIIRLRKLVDDKDNLITKYQQIVEAKDAVIESQKKLNSYEK